MNKEKKFIENKEKKCIGKKSEIKLLNTIESD